VFDALDRDGDGFVRVEEFVQFATAYGAEQVKELTKYLDPSGLGVISFEDFHRGIRAIKNGDPDSQLYDMGYTPEEEAPACPDEFDDFKHQEGRDKPRQVDFEFNLFIWGWIPGNREHLERDWGSQDVLLFWNSGEREEAAVTRQGSKQLPELDLPLDRMSPQANEVTDSAYMGSESTYSECETFTDEDTSTLVQHEMHDEVETDSAIDSTVHSEFTDPIEEQEHGSHPHELALGSELSHSIVTVISGEEHFEDYGEGNEADLFPDPLCNGESSFGSSSFLSPSPNKRLSSKKVASRLRGRKTQNKLGELHFRIYSLPYQQREYSGLCWITHGLGTGLREESGKRELLSLPIPKSKSNDPGVKSQEHVHVCCSEDFPGELGGEGTCGIPGADQPLWHRLRGRAVSPGVTWCQHGAGAGADARAAVGRGGLSPFQAAAPDELAGSGGDGGILQGQPGLHRRGHHRQGEGSFPPSLGLAIGIKLILAEFFEMLRGKGHRMRWERCCLCHPAGFSALQCPSGAGRRNGLFTGSIFTSPSHKKMFSGSAFLSQPTQCETETSSLWHTLMLSELILCCPETPWKWLFNSGIKECPEELCVKEKCDYFIWNLNELNANTAEINPVQVVFLEKRVTELEKDTAANGEQHSRLRQENLQLVHRANALEEQLKEQELRADQTLLEEIKKQRELLSKMEREKSIEIENLQARLQQLDDENSELRSCVPCLRANIERLEEEKQKLLDEIEDLTVQLTEEQEKKRKMGDKLSQERHQFQKEKESTQELIEDLRKQLEHLQLFKLEAEQRRGRSSSMGLQEYNSRTRETELEQEIKQLKQDNRNLKEQNDELNGQIINLSIQGAKNLFSASFSESLAAEISSVSRDELMEAIQKQEEINFRLQDYIDRIIVAIMETNPSILEVNPPGSGGVKGNLEKELRKGTLQEVPVALGTIPKAPGPSEGWRWKRQR
ncbi:Rab11 family-interacting protein 3, partial [Lamprotornis superbus]